MRRFLPRGPVVALSVVALASLTGCKKDAPVPAATETPAAPATVSAVEITASDAMQFSTTAFTVKAGSDVTVTLKNIGTQPKESMGHNFVLLQSGSDVAAFGSAAAGAKDTDYLPAGDSTVIVHTKLLGPGETEALTFKAPATPGEYPFLCSFPGHYFAMKGIMTVVQ